MPSKEEQIIELIRDCVEGGEYKEFECTTHGAVFLRDKGDGNNLCPFCEERMHPVGVAYE